MYLPYNNEASTPHRRFPSQSVSAKLKDVGQILTYEIHESCRQAESQRHLGWRLELQMLQKDDVKDALGTSVDAIDDRLDGIGEHIGYAKHTAANKLGQPLAVTLVVDLVNWQIYA